MVKILVVDDNAASRELLRAALRRPDWCIIEASQGREALEIITAERPDLVLLDIEMPVMDGFAVLRKVRDNPSAAAPRIVAVTANAMQGVREEALAAGFDDYVTKPVSVPLLRQRVASLLSSQPEVS